MSTQSRYTLRSRSKLNRNGSHSSSDNVPPSISYEPLTVVEFPLYDAKWCCKCLEGPPIANNNNIVECGLCETIWGCRTCHGIAN